MTTRIALLLGFLVAAVPAVAQTTADHLQCFKIKDSTAKAEYSADLLPADGTFPAAPGCTVKVPAKQLCVAVTKSNVSPPPPGSPAGAAAQTYLCYKAKCPKAQPTTTVTDQFGTHAVAVRSTALLCAPAPASTTSTSTTTVPTTSTTTTTLKPAGSACVSAAQCASAVCGGGFCCATACTTQSVCGATGSCNAFGACVFAASTTVCAPQSCSGGVQTNVATCDGAGSCSPGTTVPCSPYVCGANSCKTTCASAADCASGFTCNGGVCS